MISSAHTSSRFVILMIAIAGVSLLVSFLLFPFRSALAATVTLRPDGLGSEPLGQGIPDNEDGLDATDDFDGLPAFGSLRWMDTDDDPSHDGDDSYVETTGDDNGDLYTLTDPAFATGTVVNGVQLCAIMRRASNGQRGGFFGLKSGATESWGPMITWPGGQDTDYAQYCRTYATDPHTGSGWTKAALDALEVGFFSNDDILSGLRATQIFVTVDVGASSSAGASSASNSSSWMSSIASSSMSSSMPSSSASVASSTGSSASSVSSSTGSSMSSTGSSAGSVGSSVSSASSTGSTIPPGPLCNGMTATIYVSNGMIVGGRDDGEVYGGELRGTWGMDVIVGTENADEIKGRSGDDVICGVGGDDTLDGGFSDDWIDGGSGEDVMDGGMGEDVLRGGDGDDTLDGGMGEDHLFGGAGSDVIDGKMGEDIACGGDGDDILEGGFGDDRMDGGTGTDAVDGGSFGSDQCVNAESALRCAVTAGSVPECAEE